MLVRAEASVNQVHVELDAANDLPSVHGDRIQLEQVVLNLVRNAIEAITGAGQSDGHIRVIARRLVAPPRVEIGVLDNGPGVDDDREYLFAPLRPREGLGLAFDLRFPESHWARLVHSGRERDGISFSLARTRSAVAMAAPTIFVIDDHEPVRHALGRCWIHGHRTRDTFFKQLTSRVLRRADVRMPGTRHSVRTWSSKDRAFRRPVFPVMPMCQWLAGIKSGWKFHRKASGYQTHRGHQPGTGATSEQQDLRKSQDDLKFARLTARQVEIFDLVQGFTSHAIAAVEYQCDEGYALRSWRRCRPRASPTRAADPSRRIARRTTPDRCGYFLPLRLTNLGQQDAPLSATEFAP